MRDEEKHKRRTLVILTAIGLAITGITVIQFILTSQLYSSIATYEDDLNAASLMRVNLFEIYKSNLDLNNEIHSTDQIVVYENSTGIITEGQANNTISSLRGSILNNNAKMLNLLFIWDSEYTNIPPISGGYVVNPEFRWLFTEAIIEVYWLPRWYSESAILEERYSYWNNSIYPLSFAYSYTAELLGTFDDWVYPNNTRGLMKILIHGRYDWSPIWFYLDISIYDYDMYVEEHLLIPKLNNESQLGFLRIANFATTIGVLLLGFVIDFGERYKFKYFYIILIIITLLGSLWYTGLSFI